MLLGWAFCEWRFDVHGATDHFIGREDGVKDSDRLLSDHRVYLLPEWAQLLALYLFLPGYHGGPYSFFCPWKFLALRL